jgi:hypothetical protein
VHVNREIKKDEMGGASGTYGRVEVRTEFWWGNLKEREKLEDAGVIGRIIVKWISGFRRDVDVISLSPTFVPSWNLNP